MLKTKRNWKESWQMNKLSVKGALDLHLHCGPEAIPRKYDFIQLSRDLQKNQIGGAVIKSHFHSTAPWAYMAAVHGGKNLFGSIVLNHYVGGINPHALLASLGIELHGQSCLKVVWMPTLHAKGHIQMQINHGQIYDIPTEWTGGAISRGRQRLSTIEPITILGAAIKDKLLRVLDIIAENDLVLATGHLTREEVMYLVPLASSMGIKKIILTHPLYPSTGLSKEDMKDLIQYDGVYLEQSYGLVLIDGLPIREIVDHIKIIGAKKTILTSDLGQCQTIEPVEGIKEYIDLLVGSGISQEEIKQMIKINPKKLLGM